MGVYGGLRQSVVQMVLMSKETKKRYRIDCDRYEPQLSIKVMLIKPPRELHYIYREIDFIIPLQLPVGRALVAGIELQGGKKLKLTAIPVDEYTLHVYGNLGDLISKRHMRNPKKRKEG